MENEDKGLDGSGIHTLSIRLLEETYQRVKNLCERNEWGEEEGLQIVLATGVAYMDNERTFSRWEWQDSSAELLRLARLAAERDAMYSVMKFRAFECSQAKQTLEFNVTGLRGLNAMAGATIQRLTEENQQLKAELGRPNPNARRS
jgi:hypothetical protein